MRIYLSGPMGAGKSTLARELGKRLGVPSQDLDERIERRAGTSIQELFAQRGESHFRHLERQELRAVLAERGPQVVALGGGAVCDAASRAALLEGAFLVTLRADVDVLARRVGDGGGRPLLAGDVVETLREVVARRAGAYAECHLAVDTGALGVHEAADAILAEAASPPCVVPLAERTYRVWVGEGVRARLGALAREAVGAGRCVVVGDEGSAPWAEEAAAALAASEHPVTRVRLPSGEEHKTVRTVERIWDAALGDGADRGTLLVGVGGGVVGDLTGFAASTLLRGVAFGQVPTTLLAMVDSSVGGKTGFNRPEGKNLVGTFHQPRFVLCDVATLATLPAPERVAGLAEVAKSAWLDGEASVAALEREAVALAGGDPAATSRAIRMAVRLKARIVSSDERESGARMLLNLGHTVGHGLEAAADYRGLRHGEAVSLGMVAAMRVSRGLGEADASTEQRCLGLLRALGLPVALDDALSDRALAFVGADKKRRGAAVRFVLPGAPGRTRIEPLAPERIADLVRRAPC